MRHQEFLIYIPELFPGTLALAEVAHGARALRRAVVHEDRPLAARARGDDGDERLEVVGRSAARAARLEA